MDLRGKVVTGDALFAQREFCKQIVEAGGEYLFKVKANQPTLLEDIAILFADPPTKPEMVVEKDRHGDRQEVRRIEVSTALNEYSDWPYLAQVYRIEREVTIKGETKREMTYGVTSLWPGEAGPKQILKLNRGHWGIENRLHYVRDVTFGEDASQVRTAAAPQVMAALRNTVIGLLRQAGVTNIAEALRRNAARPHEALALMGIVHPKLDR
ncbi:MAG: ISAs1 family transposase [Dehalococcoidia bacterium]|nr:ISAs1 family transposase [Dehalococcoidia bacterium]